LVASGLTRERIHVAPDAVDLDDFANPESKAAARTRLGVPQEKKAAFYIGILDPWKGTDTLYATAKLLSPDIQTVVIGGFDGEEQALIPLHPEVQFLGYRPYTELPGNQQAADVLVLPNSGKEILSAKYTSPLKLFTYMASGVPIVASDLPSLREVLSEKNAYLATPDDAQSFAEKIREALASPDEAKKRATQARADVERYTWTARAGAILQFLRV
jgi:glycosyltransferase involved in cell wall biosynthesis